MGPLLFLLFINDLPLYVNNVYTDLYADDTTLYDIHNSLEDIESNLQIALGSLNTWCKCIGMLLNSPKTKIMLVTTARRGKDLLKIVDLKFNEESLSMITSDTILDVFVDQNFTWSDHIRRLNKRNTSSIWLLSKVQKIFLKSTAFYFISPIFNPILIFVIVFVVAPLKQIRRTLLDYRKEYVE